MIAAARRIAGDGAVIDAGSAIIRHTSEGRSSAQSHPLKRQIPRARGYARPERVASHGHETESRVHSLGEQLWRRYLR